MNTILKYSNSHMVILLAIILLFNCESYIDVDLPDSQLIGETGFNDLGTAETAGANIYSELSNNIWVCGVIRVIRYYLGVMHTNYRPIILEFRSLFFIKITLLALIRMSLHYGMGVTY